MWKSFVNTHPWHIENYQTGFVEQSDSAFYYSKLTNKVATEKRVFDQQIESSALLAEIYYSRKQRDSA